MEHDLHSLLAAARDDAPPPRLSIDDITAAGRQLVRRRRRTALLSSVAGGLAVVITGAAAAVLLISPPAVGPTADPNGNPGLADVSPSPARRADFVPAGAFETNYTGYTSGRYIVSDPDLVTAAYQQSSIDLNPAAPVAIAPTVLPSISGGPASARTVSPGREDVVPREGRLVVYGAGAFDPREFLKGEKLQVAGRTALLANAGDPSASTTGAAGKYGCCLDPIMPTLAWQYLPDAWAAIYWSSFETAPTRAELIALAGDLPADDPRAFPTGIGLRNIPKGYRLIAVSNRRSSYDETNLSVVRLAMKPLVGPFVAPVSLDEHPSLILTLGVSDPETGAKLGKSPCPPVGSSCASLVADGQFFLQVESNGDRPLGQTELSQVLKSMTAAPQPEDRTSWPPATSIFTP